MTGSQYNNVVRWTAANMPMSSKKDSFEAARTIFTNLGVAFPHGDSQEILLQLMSEDYMGWMPCTYAQAQEYANAGVAALGVDTEHAVVILPEAAAVSHMAAPAAGVSVAPYARQAAEISLEERMTMQFFAYYGSTATRVPAKVKDNQLFGQADQIPFPAGSGYSGSAFHSRAFLTEVCGKTQSTGTISTSGCAVCAVGMFILYKGGMTNNDNNIYYAVKEATIKSTNEKFDYQRNSFTAYIGFLEVSVTQNNTNIIPTSKDLTAVKNALLEDKCVVLCLKTKTGTHFVLADELTANSGDDYLDRIKVADPADGTRKTLRQAIQRQMNPASASHVISGYCIY